MSEYLDQYRNPTPIELKLAAEAYQAQDACNLSGVVGSFTRAMSELYSRSPDLSSKGTVWRNRHPVSVLYACKLAELSGAMLADGQTYLDALDYGRSAKADLERNT